MSSFGLQFETGHHFMKPLLSLATSIASFPTFPVPS